MQCIKSVMPSVNLSNDNAKRKESLGSSGNGFSWEVYDTNFCVSLSGLWYRDSDITKRDTSSNVKSNSKDSDWNEEKEQWKSEKNWYK